jgi:ABC-2 type transport system ATP-binding protein
MIRVKNLTKYYGPTLAVDNISFHVPKDEIVGFLGPNGAGKSTTIRILTCYHPATSGYASVAGHDVFTQSMQVREKLGYLPESTPLYQEMRVREYLDFRLKLRGVTRVDRPAMVKKAVDRVWLGDMMDRQIGHLSKGYRQRVGLAEAIMHEPAVIILDEPTIGLDPTQIRETRSLIRDLAKSHTVMLSSHILSEVEAVCDRVIIIAKGKIVASGTPDKLREKLTADSRLIAEIRGPNEDVVKTVGGIAGVHDVKIEQNDGWNRLKIDVDAKRDVREDLFTVTTQKGWALREMRREVASLEDFFVQITAQQQESRQD